jgi:hypothetical protein
MDDIDKAILCLFDEKVNDKIKESAKTYLEKIFSKDNKEIWKISFKKILNTNTNDQVIFWNLQKLIEFFQSNEKQKELETEERELIKKLIFSFMFDKIFKFKTEVFIKNKFSQLLVSIFRIEYSENRWDNFFKDLFKILNNGEEGIDMFLRIMKSIDDDIVARIYEKTKEDQKRNDYIVKKK